MNARSAKISFQATSRILAVAVPIGYLLFYTPYGMDTTDFGYFYAYAWRILNGQIPYRDFFYIKPAFPLFWHAFWMMITPDSLKILAGKCGFMLEMLGVAWFGALYLAKIFRLAEMGLPLSLLATCGFVFGIHTFPHMPWHTADGALFSVLGLYFSAAGSPVFAGIGIAFAVLSKQSFLLMPFAVAIFYLIKRDIGKLFLFLSAFALVTGIWCLFLLHANAWKNFLEMTTGQLALQEALDAGILIYLRQNWLLPFCAFLPWLLARIYHKTLCKYLYPCYSYIGLLFFTYIYLVFTKKEWIGFGLSWPVFFILTGVVEALLPKIFLSGIIKRKFPSFPLPSFALAAGLLAAWSCAISGGYKTPAFVAVIPLFCFFLLHYKLGGKPAFLALLTLFAGLTMFGCGQLYPYVFPQRSLARSQLSLDAGEIYPKASHVFVDQDMYERLRELKELRQEFGAHYKTLPGFTLANFLNDDSPTGKSDWYIDWEINGKVAEAYQDLLENRYIIFMERDQADAKAADNYARAGYSVPQLVRRNWHLIRQTPHFLVYEAP